MRFVAKKASEQFENAFGQSPFGAQETAPRDEVDRGRANSNPKSNGKIVGEYIEFEEID